MGLYPELVARREEKGRDYPRWKARLYAAYATLQKYPHVAVTLETEHHHEVIRTHVLMISNNSYDLSRLGIEAPRRALEEGRLSVYWLPHVPRLALTSFVAHYLAGRVHEAPGFRSFRTSRVKMQSSKHHLHLGIDGEVVTMDTPLVITIVPQSLQRESAATRPPHIIRPPYDHRSDQGSPAARRRKGHHRRLAVQQAHLGEAAVSDHPRWQRLSAVRRLQEGSDRGDVEGGG